MAGSGFCLSTAVENNAGIFAVSMKAGSPLSVF